MPRSVINATVAASSSSNTGGSGGGGTGDVVSSGISADNAIARWDGTSGKLIQTSGIILNDTADINNVRSVGIVPTASNPGGVSTLWINSGTGKLFRGAVDVEGSASGDVVGPASSTDNSVARFDSTSGKLIQTSPIIIGDTGAITGANSLTMAPAAANPGGVATLWLNSGDSDRLYRGAVSIEEAGVVIGVSSDTGNILLDAGTPGTVRPSFLSVNTTGTQFTLSDSTFGTFLKSNQNESLYFGVGAGNTYNGVDNCCIGPSAMNAHTLGNGNTAIGSFCMKLKTNADFNTCIGSNAAANLLTGSLNVIVGNSAGSAYTSSESNNICIGSGVSGVAAESAVIRIGSNTQTKCFIAREFKSNTATLRIGNQAGVGLADTNTTSGCTLIGNQTGINSSTFTNATLVGNFAGRYCTGNANTIVGSGSLSGINSTGNNNACLGWNIAASTTSAQGNLICGTNGAISLTSGSTNTLLGNSVAQALNSASNCICIGAGAGNSLTTGNHNVCIANGGVAAEANTTRIGTAANQTRTFISGISGITTGLSAINVLCDANGQLGTVSSSRLVKENIREIEDTSFIQQIELKNFEYINGSVLSDDPESPDYNKKQKQAGVIAEDIELIKPELVIKQGDAQQTKTVDYNYLFICALKEIQKLTARVAALEAA